MFVNFEGTKELTVDRRDINKTVYEMTSEDWATIFPEFVEL